MKMKKICFVLSVFFVLSSCGNDDDNSLQEADVTFSFNHNWDGTEVTSLDFNTIQYTNANGEELSIERLRYLVSRVMLTNASNQEYILSDYNLIDVGTEVGLTFTGETEIPTGAYTMSFIFGFNNQDNIDGAYLDLNSTSFNVPMMLGGGYHYMQFDGKYINTSATETGFNYHVIRAVDNPGTNPIFPQDTFFEVDLGTINISNDVSIEVEMNIAEWFRSPHIWNLNDLDTVLMPNSSAQIMMYDNGQSVFSLGTITQ